MARIWSFLIGYALGLIQTGYIVGKCKGVDIRNYGSGNSGTTNALRVLGTKVGLIVFAGDMLKAVLATVIVRLVFGGMYPELKYLLIIYSGAGCILGHDFPFYMHFKGGKGIAATGGMVLGFHGSFFVTGLCFFFIPFLLTHYVSLGSLIVYAGFFIQLVITGQMNLFGMFDGVSQAVLNEMYIIVFLLLLLAYWQHRANIVRLIKGTERKTYLGKKNDDNLPDTSKG
ncbi:MAG: glycerol-3-phosphate 1-O-acyltransferase PlsY [Lachnospiraceae bacterium]|nr:glycerol-3-phosphate 1-O-acyltransferase PlsY [Lachnospiraceae bacterium]